MKRSNASHLPGLLLVLLCALTLALLVYPAITSATQSSDLKAVKTAWERARQAGSYRFTADILQTSLPKPTVTNVGRTSKQQSVRIEGETNLPERTMHMSLWSQGGSVLRAESGVEVRVEDERAFARQGPGPWEEINDFTGLFAPQGDLMTFLAAAKDIVKHSTETHTLLSPVREGVTFTRYTFRVDGLSYATYLREQIQQHMAERGELPPGVNLGLPRQYVDMTGQGELWLDSDGLPLRQIIHLEMPERPDERIEVDITVDFSAFGYASAAQKPAGDPQPSPGLTRWNPLSHLPHRALRQAALLAGTLILVSLMIVHRRSKKQYVALAVALIVCMVTTPLLRSLQAADFASRQAGRAREQEQRREESEMALTLRDLQASQATSRLAYKDITLSVSGEGAEAVPSPAPWPGVGPVPGFLAPPGEAGVPSCEGEDGTDSDRDGLTDCQEGLLGTDPNGADSDGDTITDTLEVQGFEYGGRTWHTDPLAADTNQDGIGDGQEWNIPGSAHKTWDLNNDHIPDLFDRDNDGDGVPDNLDLSPYQTINYTHTFTNPLSLVVDDLNPAQPTYVEFQLRPVNPDHLWYAFNVLDWPQGDRRGQMQDADGKTFHDVDPNTPLRPNANGDLKLVPMLEIRITGSRTNLPPPAELEPYGVFVQDLQADGLEKAVYVPLHLITDDRGDAHVAFYGKMLYRPEESWGNVQEVRLLWLVQALVDQCAEDGYQDGTCKKYSAYNQPQVLHTYYDDWVLTGLNVREDHGVDVAFIYNDPALDADLDDDTPLIALSHGLDHTFLAARTGQDGRRDMTVSDIQRRFDHATNAAISEEERWGITNTLSVEIHHYAHVDQALATIPMTDTQELLERVFTPHGSASAPITPTLMFAREERFRAVNLDAQGQGGHIEWSGGQLTVHLPRGDQDEVQVTTLAGMNWAPYRFRAGWEACPMDDYWGELARRHPFADVEDAEQAAGLQLGLQLYYLALYQGANSVVQVGDLVLETDAVQRDRPVYLKLVGMGLPVVVTTIYNLASQDINPELTWKYVGKFLMEVGFKHLSPLWTWPAKLAEKYKEVTWLKWLGSRWAGGVAAGLALAGLAGLVTLTIWGYVTGVEWIQTGVEWIQTKVSIVQGIMKLMELYKTIKTVVTWVRACMAAGESLLTSTRMVLTATSAITGASKAAAIIGLVIEGLVIWVAFFIQAGKMTWGSLGFDQLLALAIAATIQMVVMFVLSVTVIGAIIVCIFGLIDLFLSAFLDGWTLSGWVNEQLAKLIYHFEKTVDTDVDMGALDKSWREPGLGASAGNRLSFNTSVTTTVTHKNPEDWRLKPYLPLFYTQDKLRSTTFKYQLTQSKTDVPAGRDGMTSEWRVAEAPPYWGKTMWTGWAPSGKLALDRDITLQPGVNRTMPLYLNTGYALPAAECWSIPIILWPPVFIPICYGRTLSDHSNTDVGKDIVLDVFPATLDEFYAMDWGLPLPRDGDGDGLLSRAYHGDDPDDTRWDTDGDGLSDGYEMQLRQRGIAADLGSPDADGDGLGDADEVRLGSNPSLPDTDGDGLGDGEEVFHQVWGTADWAGGWPFAYTYAYTDTQQISHTTTLAAFVTSDPLQTDADGDGMDDLAEKRLGPPYHPRVWNPSPLPLYAEISDADGFVAPGQSFHYTATVHSSLDKLYAHGGLAASFPGAITARNMQVNAPVYAIAVSGDDVYLGGQFTTAGGLRANHIARWNRAAQTWSPLGDGLDGPVRAIAVSGDDVYVGGDFTAAGGVSANHIARWNRATQTWSPLGDGLDGPVYAIAVDGDDLYLGGEFTTAGGVSANHVASWTTGRFTQVSAGKDHTCGLRSDGSLACWGDDRYGQMSDPNSSSDTFTQVSAGWQHTCGLRSDGSLACWGNNSTGQASPLTGDFTQVSAGMYHTCGVRSDGSLACWGDDRYGQMSGPNRSSDTLTQVSGGVYHTCGVRSDGSLECWGDNNFGQALPPGGSFTQISAGGWHTCGLRSDGSLACWGYNQYKQALPPGGRFTQVSAGWEHTCGVRSDGSLACWGDNTSGQATPPGVFSPMDNGLDRPVHAIAVSGGEVYYFTRAGRFTQVSAGRDHTCGVRSDGSLACWGDDSLGQASPPTGGFTQVSAGSEHACGVRSDGSLACWGGDGDGQRSGPNRSSDTFTQVSAGGWRTCGVRSDGSVECWGQDLPPEDWGEGGSSPILPPSGSFSQTSVGTYHNCGVKSDGSLECWGGNYSGEAKPPAGSFSQVSAGDLHTCGVRSDGSLECWGKDRYGKVSGPNSSSDTFTQVSAGHDHTCGVRSDGSLECWGQKDKGQATPPGGRFTQVSAGAAHACGLKSDGSLACWGDNGFGQAAPPGIYSPQGSGPGGTVYAMAVSGDDLYVGGDFTTALGVSANRIARKTRTFTQLSAGAYHTCGVWSDGSLECWGQKDEGQATPPGGRFTQVSAGYSHTCGLRSDGSLACWGGDGDGQRSGPNRSSDTFTHVSARGWRTCGVRSDGSVECWGQDLPPEDWGEGGSSPILPPSGSFSQTSVGTYHNCGVKSDGSLECWGGNYSGEAKPPAGSFTQVSAGDLHTCGVKSDRSLECWGDNSYGRAAPPDGRFTQVSAGHDHTCGVRSDGSLECWGDNSYGRAAPPAGRFTQVSAGAWHTCGLRSDGSLACWGDDNRGQASPPSVYFPLGDGLDGTVYAMAVSGDDLYVGGDFTTAGGLSAQRIARWNRTTQSWSPLGGGLDGLVRAIGVSGDDVYAGGDFTTADGMQAAHLAGWNDILERWAWSDQIDFSLSPGQDAWLTRTLTVDRQAGTQDASIASAQRSLLCSDERAQDCAGIIRSPERVITSVQIDADPPTTSTVTSLADGQYLQGTGQRLIVGGVATDTTSYIAQVEVSVDGRAWETATGAESWAYEWHMPMEAGRYTYTIRTRATDAVGNVFTETTGTTVILDVYHPDVTTPIPGGAIVTATLDADGRWTVPLYGNVKDRVDADVKTPPGSGVRSVEVLLEGSGAVAGQAWQKATLSSPGGQKADWSLAYVLPLFDNDQDAMPDPSGEYRFLVRATDKVGNVHRSPLAIPLRVDNTAPLAEITYTGPYTSVITQPLTLSGVITDPGLVASGVGRLEIAYTPAELVGKQDTPDWQEATLARSGTDIIHTTWSHSVPGSPDGLDPGGLEGIYQIDLRGSDVLGNRNDSRAEWNQWRGDIDTLAPRVEVTIEQAGTGEAARTQYTCRAEDFNLVEDSFQCPCPVRPADRAYHDTDWWRTWVSDTTRLYRIETACLVEGHQPISTAVVRACDRYGRCSTHGPGLQAAPPITSPLDSVIFSPGYGTVLTTTNPISVAGGVYAERTPGLKALTVTVDSTPIYTTTWEPNSYGEQWATTWIPSGEGPHSLASVAADHHGYVQTDLHPVTITLDTQPPQITVPAAVLTTAHRLSFGRVALSGPYTEMGGVEAIQVGAEDGYWGEAAAIDDTTWRYAWYLGEEPDGKRYPVTAVITDVAGRSAQDSGAITVDLVPPAPLTVTLAYTDSSGTLTPLTQGQIIRDVPSPTLTIEWTASSDGSGLSGYLAGWSAERDGPLADLSEHTPAERRHEQPVGEAQAVYAHVVTRDSHGNQGWQTLGPIYTDMPTTTPDYITDLAYHGWTASGCTQIGADRELVRNAYTGQALTDTQRLYMTWDADALRLAWTGADWNNDGDLFIYFDTGEPGGATAAYDPYTATMTDTLISLPAQDGRQLEADYLIWVEDASTARLMHWSGGDWVPVDPPFPPDYYRLDTTLVSPSTDLYVPFSLLGISDPSAARLRMVALASEEDALRLWAAMPEKNPLNSKWVVNTPGATAASQEFQLTQQYEWASLGPGLCPNAGQFADADLQVDITSDPVGVEVGYLEQDLLNLTPGAPLDADLDGVPDMALPMDTDPNPVVNGQTITYSVHYANQGTEVAPGVRITVTARGALDFGGTQELALDLGDVGAGVAATHTFTGVVDTSAGTASIEVDALVADAVHEPFDWFWIQHDVGGVLPEQEGGQAYVVQPGDYLSKLAARFYGNPRLWPVIQEATNAKATMDSSFAPIANPNLIRVGQKLWIPDTAEGYKSLYQK